MYLASGVTTVIDLSGGPTELDWRRRLAAGELPGPTVYTSGPFLNEPRVNTPEEVRREVAAQARDGYDAARSPSASARTCCLWTAIRWKAWTG